MPSNMTSLICCLTSSESDVISEIAIATMDASLLRLNIAWAIANSSTVLQTVKKATSTASQPTMMYTAAPLTHLVTFVSLSVRADVNSIHSFNADIKLCMHC